MAITAKLEKIKEHKGKKSRVILNLSLNPVINTINFLGSFLIDSLSHKYSHTY